MNKLIFLFYIPFCIYYITDAFPFSRILYNYHTLTHTISESNGIAHNRATYGASSIKLRDTPSYYSYDGHINDDDEENDYDGIGNGISDVQAAREKLEALMMIGSVGGGSGSTADTTTTDTATVADSSTAMIAEKSGKQEISTKKLLQKGKSLSFLKPFINSTTFEIAILPPSLPLTAKERQRRYEEIKFLKCLLKNDDENLNDLYNFWFYEKGQQAATTLEKADALIGEGKEGWADAEKILRYLIEDYGVYWTEPINCLATLCYLQGRYLESKILYKWVLSVKPWHCGALSGIVRVYEATKDWQSARQCSPNRLPRLPRDTQNRRRCLWVYKALIRSAEALKRAEESTDSLFGEHDDRHYNNDGSINTSNSYFHNRNKHSENSDYDNDNFWQ